MKMKIYLEPNKMSEDVGCGQQGILRDILSLFHPHLLLSLPLCSHPLHVFWMLSAPL